MSTFNEVYICSQIIVVYLQTHKIKKFVLHTNYPGHADFNSYMKCNFVIHCSDCELILHDLQRSFVIPI